MPSISFGEYQTNSGQTRQGNYNMPDMVYFSLGLMGEAGEVAEKVKKIFRDRGGNATTADRESLKKEAGDVLWYLTQICGELDIELEQVAIDNLEKLLSRKQRGVISGEGDER